MTHWTETAIAAELAGKFYGLDGLDLNRHDADSQEQVELARKIERIKAQRAAELAGKVKRKIEVRGRVTAAAVVLAVASAHRITPEEVVSRSRRRSIMYARQHACALIRELTGMSYPAVAAAVNLKDHTTAWHACKVFEGRRDVFANHDIAARQMLGVE